MRREGGKRRGGKVKKWRTKGEGREITDAEKGKETKKEKKQNLFEIKNVYKDKMKQKIEKEQEDYERTKSSRGKSTMT